MTNIRCNATLLWIFPSASFFYVLYISMWLSVVKQLRTVRVRQLLERRSSLSHSVNKTRDIMHFNDTNQTIFCNHQLFNTNYWNNVSEISYIPETKWRPHNQSCSPGRHFFSSQNRYPKISSVYFGGKAVKLHSRAFSISLSTSRGTTTLTHLQEKKKSLAWK